MRGGRERTTRTLLWHSDPGLGALRGSHRAVRARAVQRLEQTAPNISPVRSHLYSPLSPDAATLTTVLFVDKKVLYFKGIRFRVRVYCYEHLVL